MLYWKDTAKRQVQFNPSMNYKREKENLMYVPTYPTYQLFKLSPFNWLSMRKANQKPSQLMMILLSNFLFTFWKTTKRSLHKFFFSRVQVQIPSQVLLTSITNQSVHIAAPLQSQGSIPLLIL